jgi:hypothetical protein
MVHVTKLTRQPGVPTKTLNDDSQYGPCTNQSDTPREWRVPNPASEASLARLRGPHVAATWHPRASASCAAAVPTLLPPPMMSTRSPGFNPPAVNSARHAVSAANGIADASES